MVSVWASVDISVFWMSVIAVLPSEPAVVVSIVTIPVLIEPIISWSVMVVTVMP